MEEQKFRIGQVVFEKIHPVQKMIVTSANGKLYTCKLQEDMKRPAIVFSERDLGS